jgi:3-methyl-2-oxobutanoate hydroxymethyltransferase
MSIHPETAPKIVTRTVPDFFKAKQAGKKLTVLTAYDYTMAKLIDCPELDAILVGDSLGMVIQGDSNPLAVTMDEMIYHTRCVARGTKYALVIGDLPFLSYHVDDNESVRNAGRFLKEAGAQAVKLEGGVRAARIIRRIVDAEIPVMGHVGLTPQSVHRLGGFKVQRDAEQILADALAVEEAGAFAVVLECVPAPIAKEITAKLKIPTIGIGAGPACDGQVLVGQDMLGMFDGIRPKFVKRYAEIGQQMRSAVAGYCAEVKVGAFPDAVHAFK